MVSVPERTEPAFATPAAAAITASPIAAPMTVVFI
jgi:hypothetical protein